MAVRLGSNILALTLGRRLNEHTDELSKVLERLSSGQRINGAGDDAAGLALRDSLRADRRVYTQAIRNINDGISVTSIMSATLAELQNIAARQLELAEQAANGTYTLTQRKALHDEANALVEEFNRIVTSTSYNGIHLLDGSRNELTIQVGEDSSALSSISLNLDDILARNIGTGSFSTGMTLATFNDGNDITVGDLNGDGKLDLIVSDRSGTGGSGIQVWLGNGDGTFQSAVTYGPAFRTFGIEVGDTNGDGVLDIIAAGRYNNAIRVFIGNGDGTFQSPLDSSTVYASPNDLSIGDFNGDGIIDVASGLFSSYMVVMLGTGNGTFTSPVSVTANANNFTNIADVNGDGKDDLIATSSSSDVVHVLISNGDGTFYYQQSPLVTGDGPTAVELRDFNRDGYLDIVAANFQASDSVSVFLGNANGTFAAGTQYLVGQSANKMSVGDINGDGYDDILTGNDEETLSVLLGNGNGTFAAPIQSATLLAAGASFLVPRLGDFNGDGVLDAAIVSEAGNPTLSVYLSLTEKTSTEAHLYLLTQEGAVQAITTIQDTIARISEAQSDVGAFESRLGYAFNHISVMNENLAAAESRISDADIATDVAEMVRLQILQQVTTALMAQANQNSSIVLSLLEGIKTSRP